MNPPDGNAFALYAPLIVLALVYGALFVAAAAAGTRRGPEARERMQDIAFRSAPGRNAPRGCSSCRW